MATSDKAVETFSGFARPADDLVRYVPPSCSRVLDIHTGNVARGALLRERGAEVVVGMMPEAVLSDADDSYTAQYPWDVDRWELPEDARDFQCILLDEVVPRVRDHKALLWDLRRRITDDGLLVCVLPNIQYHRCVSMVAEGHWQTSEKGVLARENLYLFTGVEGRALLNQSGFDVRRIVGLVKDSPEAFPRGEDGYVRCDGYSVGPLTEKEHTAYLIEYYLFLAVPV